MSKNFTNRQGGGQKLNRLRRKIGAVLIEFAFAIPVFLVLLYYIHDLPKQKLMQRKMQFVANEVSAIIQNIADQRSKEGKFFTGDDLTKAVRLANLSLFPGMTQYSTDSTHTSMPLGYLSALQIYYIVGTNGGAEIKWRCRSHVKGQQYQYANNQNGHYLSVNINAKTPEGIYPELRLSEGEAKIIVEYALWNNSSVKFAKTGISSGSVSKRELFGFLFFTPKPIDGFGASSKGNEYFPAITIFTANSGFPKSAPQ